MAFRFKETLAVLALATASVMPVPANADTAADEAAILEIWSTYSAARVAGDAETWLSLWDTDGIRLPPGSPALDYATFSQGIPEAFAASQPPSMEIVADEVVVIGDWAFSSGNFTVADTVDGKFLTIFRRQDDGTWRIFRDAFNMNTP
ncbi:nuclear transport factor 2 family protein [Maritalea mobilis]|uniref:YybH family protein n=1 Tax=Maritalea mobilis TaxID=483324 RepID=UPI001C971110|nr:nuclear transport factor 2 family protein [Maritalea mobilis]MBY6202495.1 nuclear transport factor 2 family protein [Maritalea mobilis]